MITSSDSASASASASASSESSSIIAALKEDSPAISASCREARVTAHEERGGDRAEAGRLGVGTSDACSDGGRWSARGGDRAEAGRNGAATGGACSNGMHSEDGRERRGHLSMTRIFLRGVLVGFGAAAALSSLPREVAGRLCASVRTRQSSDIPILVCS